MTLPRPEVHETVAGLRAVLEPGPGRRPGQSASCRPWAHLHDGHASLMRAGRGRERDRGGLDLRQPAAVRRRRGPRRPTPATCRATSRLPTSADRPRVRADRSTEMYPEPVLTTVSVPGLGDRFEGAAAPDHFAGVATVVAKLLVDRRALPGLLRREGLPAARRGPPAGGRPLDAGRRRRLPHRARARRARPVEPQRLPDRRPAGCGTGAAPGAAGCRGTRPPAAGADVAAVVAALADLVAAEPEAVLDYAALVDAGHARAGDGGRRRAAPAGGRRVRHHPPARQRRRRTPPPPAVDRSRPGLGRTDGLYGHNAVPNTGATGTAGAHHERTTACADG